MARGKPYLVKIVRDQIGSLVPNSIVSYEEVPDEDKDMAIEFLRRKLCEESIEYAIKPGLEELADIQETIRALASYDLEFGTMGTLELEKTTRIKREKRGGFDKLVGLYITADDLDVEESPLLKFVVNLSCPSQVGVYVEGTHGLCRRCGYRKDEHV
jgi:predicted house-cleaning noncanonical NTP pyrophosphatase (MazG superfamily)